jgi:two-component system KDP operon response regulator KdpE
MSRVPPLALIVAADPALRRVVRGCLSRAYAWIEAWTLAGAVEVALARRPELVVVDLAAAHGDGVELTRQLQGEGAPKVLLLADHEDAAVVQRCLDAGATDFVTKPFSSGELSSRAASALADREPCGIASVGPVTVDLERREVTVAARRVALTRPEYALLAALTRRAGRVLTLRQLGAEIGEAGRNAPDAVRRLMVGLRAKIERDPVRPCVLLTEPGIGYRAVDRGASEVSTHARV